MFSPCAALLACSVQPEFSKTKPNFPKNEALSFCFQGREDLLLFTRKSLLLGSFKTKTTNIQIVQQTNALCAHLSLIAGVCVTLSCQNKNKTNKMSKHQTICWYRCFNFMHKASQSRDTSSAVIFSPRGGKVKKKDNDFLKQQKKQNSFAKNKIYVIFISCSEAGKSSFVIGGLSGAVLLRRGSDGALGTVGWRRSGEAVCPRSP